MQDRGRAERIPRLRLRVETLIERQASEQRRRRREHRIQAGLYIVLLLALAGIGGFTAHLNSLLRESTVRNAAQLQAVRSGLDAANLALTGIQRQLDTNNHALQQNNQTLQLHRDLLTRALAETRTANLISMVDSYLTQLEATGEVEFEGSEDRADVARKLKDRIRPVIVTDLVDRPELTDGQVRRRIERLVDRDLDDF
jgi:hypothetical protein